MATLMLEGGADVRHIQEILGHVEASTTAIYTRVSIKHLVEVHRRCHPGARVVEPKKEPEVEEAKENLFEQLNEEDDEDGSEPVARPSWTGYPSSTMQALKARVQNGRLVLDEPTDLPEGEVVELRPVDDDDDGEGEFEPEELAALEAAIERSMEQARLGQIVDADDVLRKLAARG